MVTTAATAAATTARPALATLLLSKIILQQIGPQKERLGVAKILLSCKTKRCFVQQAGASFDRSARGNFPRFFAVT